LEKKVVELEKENKELKDTLHTIQEKYEEQITQEKTLVRKSQIMESSLKEELQLVRNKFGSLEQESNKMLF
jgi:hypothetical protein